MPLDAEAPPHPTLRRPVLRMLRLSFVPLTDAAPLLIAQELGLFDAVGLRVTLSAKPSWAAPRDKLAFGGLDTAHLLGPMPIALAAGLTGVHAQVAVAARLGWADTFAWTTPTEIFRDPPPAPVSPAPPRAPSTSPTPSTRPCPPPAGPSPAATSRAAAWHPRPASSPPPTARPSTPRPRPTPSPC